MRATSSLFAILSAVAILSGCISRQIPDCVSIRVGEDAARSGRIDVREAELNGIPVAIQKSQGHCAPATLERALSFIGCRVSQGQLALLGGCTPDSGTDVEALYAAVSPSLEDRGFRIREIYPVSAERTTSIAHAYNALSGAAGVFPLLVPERSAKALDLAKVFSKADVSLLRKATEASRAEFMENVCDEILSGKPLLWGVILGIVPEQSVPSGQGGGHLRLIVGFDLDSSEILYSDPWEPDCIVKRMPFADAWAITQSLHVAEPDD